MNFTAFSSRWRVGAVCAAAVVALAFASAEAATKKTDKKTEAAKPNLIGSFGDWNVFVSQAGKGRICYVLAQPKSREPENLNRDPGYAFISDRPAEGVRNEVSFIMGFDVAGGATAEASAETATDATPEAKPAKPRAKPASRTAKPAKAEAKTKAKPIGAPVATVDEQSFELLPKGADLWVKNAARESALIAEMKKGATLEIKAASLKGNESTDSYSLSGFSQAMDRLQKECPGK